MTEASETSKRPLQTLWTLCHLGIMTQGSYCFFQMGDTLFQKKHERILNNRGTDLECLFNDYCAASFTLKSKPNVSVYPPM